MIEKTSIGLDYFDASINRIAAWVVGIRSTLLALLKAELEPKEEITKLELQGDYAGRMMYMERLKQMPFGIVFDYYCYKNQKKVGLETMEEIKRYEKEVTAKRG